MFKASFAARPEGCVFFLEDPQIGGFPLDPFNTTKKGTLKKRHNQKDTSSFGRSTGSYCHEARPKKICQGGCGANAARWHLQWAAECALVRGAARTWTHTWLSFWVSLETKNGSEENTPAISALAYLTYGPRMAKGANPCVLGCFPQNQQGAMASQ